jgi:hypothetical protein
MIGKRLKLKLDHLFSVSKIYLNLKVAPSGPEKLKYRIIVTLQFYV